MVIVWRQIEKSCLFPWLWRNELKLFILLTALTPEAPQVKILILFAPINQFKTPLLIEGYYIMNKSNQGILVVLYPITANFTILWVMSEP